jgi:hypothetical protein
MGNSALPNLERLHLRHYGLSPFVNRSYAEAARVTLSRHHDSPIEVSIRNGTTERVRCLSWKVVGDRERMAWKNEDDATRDGAYAISIAAVEEEYGLFAISRAETRTGADYYVGQRGVSDLEYAYRLEVSGTSEGDASTIRTRLQQKIAQARAGESNLPALASVVGYRQKCIALADIEAPDAES